MELDDKEVTALLQRMETGDIAAFEAIYRAFQPRVYLIVMKKMHGDRDAAQDVVHETFSALISNPGGYDSRRGGFSAWLHGVAHNKVIDHFRLSGKHGHTEDIGDYADVIEDPAGVEPGAALDAETRRKALLRCLDRLPGEQRDTIISAWLREMTYEDVANMLRIELGTVKSRIHNSMQKLRKCLEIQLGTGAWR